MNAQIALSQALIGIFLLAYIWFVLVASARRDNFRTNIRRIRDRLFDYMWTNGHDFDLPAYRSTRQTLNGMIRCSNYLSVFRLVYVAYIVLREGQLGQNERSATDNAVNLLPDGDLKNALLSAKKQAATEMLTFIFFRSPSGVFAIALFAVAFFAYSVYGRIKKKTVEKQVLVEQSANHMMTDAYLVGSSHATTKNNHAVPVAS